MRLFVGLEPSPDFREALAELQNRLKAAGVTGRYLDSANLHLTLAFIGMWPENISALLPPVEQPFSLALSQPGVFPEARVLWAGVKPSPALDALAAGVRRALAAADIPFDPKPFRAHITLARKPFIPSTVNLSEIPVPAAEMRVKNVCLYRSDHLENGMAYTVIGRGKAAGEQRGTVHAGGSHDAI